MSANTRKSTGRKDKVKQGEGRERRGGGDERDDEGQGGEAGGKPWASRRRERVRQGREGLYRGEEGGRPMTTHPCRPIRRRAPLAVTQHLPVAGDILYRIVEVTRAADEGALGNAATCPPCQ